MHFFDIDRWNEIWQTISRNRKRSIMTALGVFWGIFMLVALIGGGQGMQEQMKAQFEGFATTPDLLQRKDKRGLQRIS